MIGADPELDCLLVSPREMEEIVVGTGWQIERFVMSKGGPLYVAIVRRASPSTTPRWKKRAEGVAS